jgi:hypothetical protein
MMQTGGQNYAGSCDNSVQLRSSDCCFGQSLPVIMHSLASYWKFRYHGRLIQLGYSNNTNKSSLFSASFLFSFNFTMFSIFIVHWNLHSHTFLLRALVSLSFPCTFLPTLLSSPFPSFYLPPHHFFFPSSFRFSKCVMHITSLHL